METIQPSKILIVEDQYIEAHDLELILQKNGHEVCGIARSVSQAHDLIDKCEPDMVLLDIILKGSGTGIDLAINLKERGISFIFISANSGKTILDQAKIAEPYGFVVKPFREQDVITTLEIAFYRKRHGYEAKMILGRQLQMAVQSAFAHNSDKLRILEEISESLQPHLEFSIIEYLEAGGNSFRIAKRGPEVWEKTEIKHSEATIFDDDKSMALVGNSWSDAIKGSAHLRAMAENYGIRSLAFLPMRYTSKRSLLLIGKRVENPYDRNEIELLETVAQTLGKCAMNLMPEPIVAKPAKKTVQLLPDLIGNSKKMAEVSENLKRVAPCDVSVLILGESGTGKEIIARAVHALSDRKDKPLVVVNCGTIPSNLAESLLFGHEKGAFTGALEKRIGKFEQAHGGTIFLDEIGEMSLDFQVKLLRVLQEKEIERIGGQQPIKVDVRIIAATNRNLEEEIAKGRFRLDLYYRLHIFPLQVPALRERKEDIPLLARHFLTKYGTRDLSFSDEAMQSLCRYEWPGNIRELEHLVQRHVLTANSNTIRRIQLPPSLEFHKSEPSLTKTIHQNERDYILSILEKCNGKVSGAGGAAQILNIPASTLNSKMKKLGIRYN